MDFAVETTKIKWTHANGLHLLNVRMYRIKVCDDEKKRKERKTVLDYLLNLPF